jgi:hypothetical protein
LVPALLALGTGAAWAQSPAAADFTWGASAGVVHRRLVERAEDGIRLVEETGPMLRLAVDTQLRLAGGGALRATAGAAAGRLDYDGHTQAGVPLTTATRHQDLDLAVGWRPLAPAAWGEAWLVLGVLQQRRTIQSTGNVAGLVETSTLLMPGLRWNHAFDAGGWRWEPSVQARVSVYHELDIDFGGLFDDTRFDAGRRRELVLGLHVSAPQSPWSAGLEWTRARQSASDREPVYRAGAQVATVRHPRIEIDDISLRVRRAF